MKGSSMKRENISHEKLREMKSRLGCTFCSDGVFAEMSLELVSYRERTRPIDDIEFRFFKEK